MITEILSIAVIVEREDLFSLWTSLWTSLFTHHFSISILLKRREREHGSSVPVSASILGFGPVQTIPTGISSIS